MAVIECACPNQNCSAPPHKGYEKCQQVVVGGSSDVPRTQEESPEQQLAICPPCVEANK